MPPAIQITINPTIRDQRGRFAKANAGLLEDYRDTMRFHGRRFVKIAKEEAPERTGKFSGNIRFRTFVEGRTIGFTVSSPQPLSTFIQKGTVEHPIAAEGFTFRGGSVRPRVLAFFWPSGPRGAMTYFFRSVTHRGTKANPFMGRAMRRWIPGARRGMREIGKNWIRTLQGKQRQLKL